MRPKTKIIKYEKYMRVEDSRIFYIGYFNNGLKPVLVSNNKNILKDIEEVANFETRFKKI